MPPFLQFVIRRFMTIPIFLLVITMILYGGVMLLGLAWNVLGDGLSDLYNPR